MALCASCAKPAKKPAQSFGCSTSCAKSGICSASLLLPNTLNAAPPLTAPRRRAVKSGCSLRKLAPITNMASLLPKSSMLWPSHCAPLRPSERRLSCCCKRVATCLMPKPSASFLAKYNSSTVFIGLAHMPIWSWPSSLPMHSSVWRTYSSAVGQSTSRHSPPCLIFGFFRRPS